MDKVFQNFKNKQKIIRKNHENNYLNPECDCSTTESYIHFVIDSPLMMAQSRAESTRDTYNYGQYLNQFLPNSIKVIREFERIQKKICRHKMSIMFNEICIYIYIYIFRQHFFVNANFIKHNRHFMPTYFLLDPFEFPYYFYYI